MFCALKDEFLFNRGFLEAVPPTTEGGKRKEIKEVF